VAERRLDRSLIAVLALALLGTLAFGAGRAAAVPGAEILSFEAFTSEARSPNGEEPAAYVPAQPLGKYQAGSHPDITFKFDLTTRGSLPKTESGANSIKTVLIELPAGISADPHAVNQCTASQFALNECSPNSQVGTVRPWNNVGDSEASVLSPGVSPLYNLVPQPGQPGLTAWKANIVAIPIYTVFSARTGGDYGLNAETRGITSYLGLKKFEQVNWGVPASPVHDNERYKEGGGLSAYVGPPPEVSTEPLRPLLSLPVTCGKPLTTNMVSFAYDNVVHEKRIDWPATTGCDQLNFNPSLAAKPSTEAADSASGLDTSLKVPQSVSPNTPSDTEIKANRVTLPEGFSINSSSADGKTSCSDAQAHLGRDDEAQCPEEAKIGTLSLTATSLPGPIGGGIYLADPKPGDRYRIIAIADGYATHIKLPASVKPDPKTGQLTTYFDNLPQSPYTEFDLHFFGSERGLLATPTQCGTYSVDSEFVPWANELPSQTSTQFFSITSGPGGKPCPGSKRPFSPGFRAVGQGNGAGAHSAFSIYVTRPDGDQTLNTIQVNTPPGFSATLKGVPACGDGAIRQIESPLYTGLAEQLSPKCPSSTQIGQSWASVGAGSRPFTAPGKVYLSGPYKGAPLSFTVVTPTIAGPYDLGNIVNRVAVRIDPTTTAVSAASDPLPQIIEGIPLRMKSILLNLDRKDFTLNPTSCSPFDVTSSITGDQGAKAEPKMHFQVANCDTLDFKPKLTTVLKGSTKRGGNPALTATLTQDPSGESNISRAVVTLPHSEFLDQTHIKTVCTRVQFAADNCPAASIYGQARATTPLLDRPLEGPVYLRSSSNQLPDLVAALRGPASQPVAINLVGKIDSINGGIRTTFASVPDAPVSKFVLSMKGGKRSLLENSRNLCLGAGRTTVKLAGHNGGQANQSPALQAPCKGKTSRTKRTAKEKGAR
jgi:hypothetical protein